MRAVLDVFATSGHVVDKPSRAPHSCLGSQTWVLLCQRVCGEPRAHHSVLARPRPFGGGSASEYNKLSRGPRAPICRAGTRNLLVLVALRLFGGSFGRFLRWLPPIKHGACRCGGANISPVGPGRFGSFSQLCLHLLRERLFVRGSVFRTKRTKDTN